jgi:transcription initiation factor TFIID TATA-box-binding protein
MVTLYFGEDSPAYTLYRTGTFQIRGAKTEADLEEAESHLRTVLSDVGVEMPDYEFRHVTSAFVGALDTEVNLEALAILWGWRTPSMSPNSSPLLYIDRQSLR